MAWFRKRKTGSQHIVGVATWGLPWPIRWILASRWGARLTLFLVLLAMATGAVSLDWSGGWPRLSIDSERAAEVRQAASNGLAKAKQHLPAAKERLADAYKKLPVDSESLARITEFLPNNSEGLSEVREKLTNAQEPFQPRGRPITESLSGVSGSERNLQPASSRDGSAIRIASFNIQVLGTSKAQKPDVMSILATVVRGFDVVAIQELRTKDPSVMESLLALVNNQGGTYRYVVGPRLGRSSSKEQYVFVYDSARLELDPRSVLTLDDPKDLLHREPLIAHFQTRPPNGQTPFSFILVNIHTDPDETDTELDALGDVFLTVKANPWREDDVILLGDLNVSYQKLGKLGQIPNIAYTVRGEATNTRGSKSYDNIVFDREHTQEFTGSSGILRLQEHFGLSTDRAIDVSDHQPIWAEFSLWEAGSRSTIATRPDQPIRRSSGRARLTENPLKRMSRANR